MQKKIIVNEKMQQGYSHLLKELMGKNFAVDFSDNWFVNARLSLEKKDPRGWF